MTAAYLGGATISNTGGKAAMWENLARIPALIWDNLAKVPIITGALLFIAGIYAAINRWMAADTAKRAAETPLVQEIKRQVEVAHAALDATGRAVREEQAAQIASQAAQITDLQAGRTALDDRVDSLAKTLESERALHDESKRDRAALHAQLAATQAQLTDSQRNQHDLRDEITLIMTARAEMKVENERLTAEVVAVRGDNTRLTAELATLRGEHEACQLRTASLEARVRELEEPGQPPTVTTQADMAAGLDAAQAKRERNK